MNKKQLYESIMRSVSHEVKKALNENFESNNDAAQIAYDKFIEEMSNIDDTVEKAVKSFCMKNPKYKPFQKNLIYHFQCNYDISNFNLYENDDVLLPSDVKDCTNNIELLNYGYENNVNAWFSVTWNFDRDSCKCPYFCYSVLKAIEKYPSMKYYVKNEEFVVEQQYDVHSIFATDMQIDDAFQKIIEIYKAFADLLLVALDDTKTLFIKSGWEIQ
ncbi:MAG: hypothetical protein [Wendovervirus sonii]|uniref:Uncharacterized protein n=1 Tax=phage Lak_Megaphage_Sonny TaxID=3109229 RepID=A0ABZ0Z460_9CAUD|nr:MAG: hypothetical protein [phage Lak_Megaphage_Sonny]